MGHQTTIKYKGTVRNLVKAAKSLAPDAEIYLDVLSLEDSKTLLHYGAQRLWSFTNPAGNTEYAVTQGNKYIRYTDYLLPMTKESGEFTVLYDWPERFSDKFRDLVKNKLRKLIQIKN